MSNIILLICCLVLGILLRAANTLPKDASLTLNALIVNVFVPTVTLRHTVELDFSSAFLLPIMATWLVFGAAFLFFYLTQAWTKFDRPTIGALIVVAGISSISFVGFPIFELLYGAEGLRAGIVMSQAGTFIICSTAGIFVCAVFSEHSDRINWQKIGFDVLTFPPFMAFVLAIVLNFFGYRHPVLIAEFLEKLGSPLSVAALLSIGLQMNFSLDRSLQRALGLGLFFKLLLAPLLVYLIFMGVFQQNSIPAKVSVVGSALGSMNTIGIIAIRKGLNPPLVVQILAFSIPLSLLFIPLVYWLLEGK